jgi:lysozyme family protein
MIYKIIIILLLSHNSLYSSENFEEAIKDVMYNEGGYVNHKSDKGGATNYGISLRFLKSLGAVGDINKDGIVDKNDIKELKKEQAKEIYKVEWWKRHKYNRIKNIRIATKVLDMSINLGAFNAHCILQKSLNNYGNKLKVDGIIGIETIEAINRCKDINRLMTYIIVNLSRYYLNLYTQDKKNRVNFIVGWLRRATR